MIEVSVEEGRRESFGTGWLVASGMTERTRRSFLNQRGECFAIYPHKRRERLSDVGLEMLGSSATLDRILKKLQWVKGRRRQLL